MLKNTIRMKSLLIIFAFAVIFQAMETKAAPGDYDQNFGIGGIAQFQFNGLKSIHRIAIQTDGKILVAGYADFGQTFRLFLRRHNPDGTLDTSFGLNGEAVEQTINGYKYIQSTNPSGIAFQPDGKMLVGGLRFDNAGNSLGLSVWRFTTAGLLDTAFDGDGRKDLSQSGQMKTVKMTLDGSNNPKILVLTTDGNYSTLARLSLTGGYDTNFGNLGKVKISGQYNDLATYKPEHFIFGESIYVAGGENQSEITARRYKTDGSPDTAFGSLGKITLSLSIDPLQYFTKIIVQSDGKVLLAGRLENPTYTNQGFVVHVNSSGTFEQQFGTTVISGSVGAIYNANEPFSPISDMELQSGGKIVLGRSGVIYKRHLVNGSEDAAYVQPNDSYFSSFALQKNNRLVAVEGNWVNGIGNVGYTLRRLLAD